MRSGNDWVLVAGASVGLACNGLFGTELGHLVGPANGEPEEPSADADVADQVNDTIQAAALDASESSVSEDARADVDAAGWTPAALGSALSLWLDGDRGVSSTPCTPSPCVTRWADQSGYGNDAILDSLTAVAPSWEASLYNGHGSVRFDGGSTSLTIADAVSLQVGVACTVLAVGAEQSASHEGAFYNKTAPAFPYGGIALWGSYTTNFLHGTPAAQVDINQYVTSTGGLDDGKLRVFVTTFDGTTLSLIVDNGVPAWTRVTLTESLGAAGVPARIGGNPAGNQVLVGDIAELILVTKALDSDEWAKMYAYVDAKYGLH
jgi:hypothetical protein